VKFLASTLVPAFALFAFTAKAQAASPLRHEAYIWQRVWTPAVVEAIRSHGTNFSELVVLKTEVAWERQEPRVYRARIDYAALKSTKVPIGVALRIGSFRGPFSTNDSVAVLLMNLATEMVSEARSKQVTTVELQLDFDCSESNLEGYRLWVQTIARKVSPLPVRITALPGWLNGSSFKPLAQAAGAYVLQIHSLERPKDAQASANLCDPAAALKAVEKADLLGIPFRVALPTYSYLLAFGTDGKFIGLSAEGPPHSWPENAQAREIASNPSEIAGLVEHWHAHQPRNMEGLLWFRLPSSQDTFNWRWPTLGAIISRQSPRETMRVELRRVDAKLTEIDFVNVGEIDFSSRLAVEVHWEGARLLAADALSGFEISNQEPTVVRFRSKIPPVRIRTGERMTIGWVRLDQEREVQGEFRKL
jgi:hypothetical protein